MVSFLNEWIVADYASFLQDKEAVIVLELRGLSVAEAQDMRNRVRATGATLRLARRRLAKVAFKEVGVPIPAEALAGTCALLVGDTEQAITATKAIEELWRKAKERKIGYRAAYLDGAVMSAEEAARIADMPDKETLRAQLCAALLGPGRMIAVALSEVPSSVARVLRARADQEEAA